jgi:hypothetical protein
MMKMATANLTLSFLAEHIRRSITAKATGVFSWQT